MSSKMKMSGLSPVITSAPSHSLPLTSPVTAPLKKGDEDELTRSLRPTLSFRQRPEPPKPPSQILNVEDPDRPLRPTLSFRQKPEPPQTRGITFQEPAGLNSGGNKEKSKEMQKTKSKIDMLQSLIRESASSGGAAPVAKPEDSSSDEDDSGDEAISLSQATGGKTLIRPSAPPPPPPGLSQIGALPPLPKVMIKSAPPAPPPLPPPSMSPNLDTLDDNAAENWQTMWSPEQNKNYYYNKKTGVSTWEDPTATKAPARSVLSGNRSNELEKQIHKKTMEKPKDDDEVDVFGRSTGNRGSGGSGGSQSSRMSLRATLSKAFGLTSKKPSSPLRTSDLAKDSTEPFVTGKPSPTSSDIPLPTEINSDFFRGNGSVRSNGSLISFSSAVSHDSDSSTRSHEKPIKDKHAEVVAEVHTKSGRHTIVRAKKGKKKDHSMPLPSHPDPAFDPAGQAQFSMMQQVQQQTLQRPPSSPHIVGSAYSAPIPQMQHFGAPHPQQMTAGIQIGGPSFLQTPPFAAYAQYPPPSPRGQFVPPTPPHPPPTFSPGYAAPPSQIQAQYNARYVQALYDFFPSDPNNPSEIGLRRGDVVQLMDQGVDGWWEGIHLTTGRRGLFPGSHVQYVT